MKNLLFILVVCNGFFGCKDKSIIKDCSVENARYEITKEFNPKTLPHYYDSLIDLNGDGVKELVIEHYGLAGSGLKFGQDIYHYNSDSCFFELNESFDVNSNMTFDGDYIYGFYIANGGGFAEKYKWNGNDAIKLESYDIDIYSPNDDTVSIVVVLEDFDKRTLDTLHWEKVNLPSEYRYNDYKAIIME